VRRAEAFRMAADLGLSDDTDVATPNEGPSAARLCPADHGPGWTGCHHVKAEGI
jgi:hypothetical protein